MLIEAAALLKKAQLIDPRVQREEFLKTLDGAIQEDPFFSEPYFLQGLYYFKAHDWKNARHSLQRGIDLDFTVGGKSDMAEKVYITLGKAYQNLGTTEQALLTFKAFLGLFPRAKASEKLATQIYSKLKNAKEWFDGFSMGYDTFIAGDFGKARTVFEELLSMNRNFSWTYYYIGKSAFHGGGRESALPYFLNAFEHDAHFLFCRELFDLYRELGDSSHSLQWLTKALELNAYLSISLLDSYDSSPAPVPPECMDLVAGKAASLGLRGERAEKMEKILKRAKAVPEAPPEAVFEATPEAETAPAAEAVAEIPPGITVPAEISMSAPVPLEAGDLQAGADEPMPAAPPVPCEASQAAPQLDMKSLFEEALIKVTKSALDEHFSTLFAHARDEYDRILGEAEKRGALIIDEAERRARSIHEELASHLKGLGETLVMSAVKRLEEREIPPDAGKTPEAEEKPPLKEKEAAQARKFTQKKGKKRKSSR
ncbi:MAG: hypothetical protein RDV48_03675 [Candidatus Eremiobacteraeota bacterium]|nr:hypothetical protein [Candidatus Eremiobacteraeota bacterium]